MNSAFTQVKKNSLTLFKPCDHKETQQQVEDHFDNLGPQEQANLLLLLKLMKQQNQDESPGEMDDIQSQSSDITYDRPPSEIDFTEGRYSEISDITDRDFDSDTSPRPTSR